MKKCLIIYLLPFIFFSCDRSTKLLDGEVDLSIVPIPKEMATQDQMLLLTKNSKLYTSQKELLPLLELFKQELEKTTAFSIEISNRNNKEADLIFELDEKLAPEHYQIKISQAISVKAGSYAALAMAKSTLLQLAQKEDQSIAFPVSTIIDYPDVSYRGLLVDLARQWHDMKTVKQLVDLAAFYKINYLQLHFTDHQSYTLPSKKYPKLATPGRHYNFEELKEIEAYAQLRGVTIIPEIDVPGHSYQLVKKYPEIFAIADTASNPWIINMGKEEAYLALDELIGEMSAIFKATPYFHIGGDEAYLYKVEEDPSVKAYIQKHDIGEEVHELYRHFLVRMNKIVKKHQKQMCIWEGFRREGEIEIPKDLLVFEFETNRYLPDDLVADGYKVVNTSWKPLYVVNQKKWAPETIYKWNLWRWENWWDQVPSFDPIQIEESPLVVGAQLCSWEQKAIVEIPSLRKRLPAFVERIWNTTKKQDYAGYKKNVDHVDLILSLLIEDSRQDTLLDGYNFSKELLE